MQHCNELLRNPDLQRIGIAQKFIDRRAPLVSFSLIISIQHLILYSILLLFIIAVLKREILQQGEEEPKCVPPRLIVFI
jgi:hypothetical protein